MIIKVLGLGATIKSYKSDDSITVGVNDIFKLFPVNHLVCLDKMSRFIPERLEIIKNSTPDFFYSHIQEWEFMPNFVKLNLAKVRHDLSEIDTSNYIFSSSSPYLAIHLAYKLGASKIVLYGIDFVDHWNFNATGNEIKYKSVLINYYNLYCELKKRKVNLCVSSKESALSQFLPLFPPL